MYHIFTDMPLARELDVLYYTILDYDPILYYPILIQAPWCLGDQTSSAARC